MIPFIVIVLQQLQPLAEHVHPSPVVTTTPLSDNRSLRGWSIQERIEILITSNDSNRVTSLIILLLFEFELSLLTCFYVFRCDFEVYLVFYLSPIWFSRLHSMNSSSGFFLVSLRVSWRRRLKKQPTIFTVSMVRLQTIQLDFFVFLLKKCW